MARTNLSFDVVNSGDAHVENIVEPSQVMFTNHRDSSARQLRHVKHRSEVEKHVAQPSTGAEIGRAQRDVPSGFIHG